MMLSMIICITAICARAEYGTCTLFQMVTCDTKNLTPAALIPFESSASEQYPIGDANTLARSMETLAMNTKSTTFAPIINLCYNITYKGHGTKLNAYMHFLDVTNPPQLVEKSHCDVILVFLDGTDVLINNKTAIELEQSWRSFQTDIVVSTEMSCWMGRDCTHNQVASYYPTVLSSVQTSPSLFINAGKQVKSPSHPIHTLITLYI